MDNEIKQNTKADVAENEADWYNNAYKESGVDVTAGYKAVELMKKHIAATRTSGVLSDIGGFGGLFKPEFKGMDEPVLVSGTDGVGTKLKLAYMLDKHDTIGIDCVAMCVNDIICSGASPLFFLDYIACGKNNPEKTAEIVKGISQGCIEAGCALIGGETAEHPGMMPDDEYDIAGFSVGIVDKKDIIGNTTQKKGDALIALPSSGVHSNGFSLIRKIFDINNSNHNINEYYNELGNTLGEELLTPTKIYVKEIQALLKNVKIKAISHITGGGFYENIPRVISQGLQAVIFEKSIKSLPIYDIIMKKGGLSKQEMYSVFNMGVGMVICVASQDVDKTLQTLQNSYIIGEISDKGDKIVIK